MDPQFRISDELYNGLRKQSIGRGLIKTFEDSGQKAALDAATGDVLVQNAKGNTTRFGFDHQGFIGTVTSPMGRRWSLENDPDGRMLGLTDPSGFRIGMAYDPQGNVASASNGRRRPVGFSYDDYRRLTQVSYPDGTARRIQYTEQGLATAVTDRRGITEAYEYDADGDLTAITDGNGNRTKFEYGRWRRPDRALYADGSSESYGYDNAGLLRQISVDDENLVDIEYDDKKRLAKLVYRDGETITYKYNDQGKIIEAGCGDHVVRYEYNDAGQVVLEDQNGQVIQYHYDELKTLVGMTYPSGDKVEFTYDADLRLTSVKDWNNGIHSITYDSSDRKSILRSPNGCVTTTLLTETGKPKSSVVSRGFGYGADGFSFSYEYDEENRLISMTDSDYGTRQYTYDSESQILSVRSDRPGNDETFAYDGAGNRIYANGEHASFNSLNQLLSQGTTRCTYDSRGNMIAISSPESSWKYTYNSRNFLIRVDNNKGVSVVFGYDAFGRRIWKRSGLIVTKFIWAGELLITEISGDGSEEMKREYLYFTRSFEPLAVMVNGKIYYYYNDGIGTPRRLTDEVCNVVWSADYMTFGSANIKINNIINRFRFPGQYFDEDTGLYYNRFRYYSNYLSRYLTRDPVSYIAGINFYVYVNNNPINHIDPIGLFNWRASVSGVAGAVKNVAVNVATVVTAHVEGVVDSAANVVLDVALAAKNGLNQEINDLEFRISCVASKISNTVASYKNSVIEFAKYGPDRNDKCGSTYTWWVPDKIPWYIPFFGGVEMNNACAQHDVDYSTIGQGFTEANIKIAKNIIRENQGNPNAINVALVYAGVLEVVGGIAYDSAQTEAETEAKSAAEKIEANSSLSNVG